MLRGMTPEQIDELVLQTLRKIAAEGQRGRIRGKAVRLAGPKDGDCVYKRAIMQALEDEKITLDLSMLVIVTLDPERDRYFQALDEAPDRQGPGIQAHHRRCRSAVVLGSDRLVASRLVM